jgi:hypothetical protein
MFEKAASLEYLGAEYMAFEPVTVYAEEKGRYYY